MTPLNPTMTTAMLDSGKGAATKLLYESVPFLNLAWCLVTLALIVVWRWGEAAWKEMNE